jgi:hypothetical protein
MAVRVRPELLIEGGSVDDKIVAVPLRVPQPTGIQNLLGALAAIGEDLTILVEYLMQNQQLPGHGEDLERIG